MPLVVPDGVTTTECGLNLGPVPLVIPDAIAAPKSRLDLGVVALVVPDAVTATEGGLNLPVVHAQSWVVEEGAPPDGYPSFGRLGGDSNAATGLRKPLSTGDHSPLIGRQSPTSCQAAQ